jgi:hypothetical protein
LISGSAPANLNTGMKSLFAAALLLCPLHAQITMPAWLAPYPESTPQTKTFAAYSESSYTTAAAPSAVLDHYRKLFETAGLPFVANSDGVGTNIRASASECDLMLSVRPQSTGATVRVSCAAKSPSYNTEVASTTTITTTTRAGSPRRIAPPPAPSPSEIKERHERIVAEMGIHRTREDAPAPPLVWPDWLVHLNGARLARQHGVDQSGNEYFESKFKSTAPMTSIFAFYEDLLKANGYRVYNSKLETGHTFTGVTQNAGGCVEGDNYPDRSPGPRTVIRVDFSRSYLNEPITVRVRFTAHPYKGFKR